MPFVVISASDMAWNGSTWGDNGGRTAKPILVGMADGIPNRMDRITALGNAVVPQIPEKVEDIKAHNPLIRLVESSI